MSTKEERRRAAATLLVGGGTVAAGGAVREQGIKRAQAGKAKTHRLLPSIDVLTHRGPGSGRSKAAWGTGAALVGLGTPVAGKGLYDLTLRDRMRRQPVLKRDERRRSFASEAIGGSREALDEKVRSIKDSKGVPPSVTGTALAAGIGGTALGAASTHGALDLAGRRFKRVARLGHGRRGALAALGGVAMATGLTPVAAQAAQRHGYQVTPTGVHRAKKTVLRPTQSPNVTLDRSAMSKADRRRRSAGLFGGAAALGSVPLAVSALGARGSRDSQHTAAEFHANEADYATRRHGSTRFGFKMPAGPEADLWTATRENATRGRAKALGDAAAHTRRMKFHGGTGAVLFTGGLVGGGYAIRPQRVRKALKLKADTLSTVTNTEIRQAARGLRNSAGGRRHLDKDEVWEMQDRHNRHALRGQIQRSRLNRDRKGAADAQSRLYRMGYNQGGLGVSESILGDAAASRVLRRRQMIGKSDHDRRDAAVAFGGGMSAAGTYTAGGLYASKQNAKRSRAGWTAAHDKAYRRYRKSKQMPYDQKAMLNEPKAKKDDFFRNYPTDLPGGKGKRILQRTHGAGRYGRYALPIAVVGGGAGYGVSRMSKREVPDYKGRDISRPKKKLAVIAAGAPPFIGDFAAARTAGALAPPHQRRSAEALTFGGGQLGQAAGLAGGAYGAAYAARKIPGTEDRAKAAQAKIEDWKANKLNMRGQVKNSRMMQGGRRLVRTHAPKSAIRAVAAARKPLAGVGAAAALGGIAGQAIGGNVGQQSGYNLALHNERTYKAHFNKAAALTPQPMNLRDQEQLRRRKRRSAMLSTAGGTAGLAGFGALVGAKAIGRPGKVATALPKLHAYAPKLERIATQTGLVGGGIGGANALMSGNITRKETRKAPVVKAMPTGLHVPGTIRRPRQASISTRRLPGGLIRTSAVRGTTR